MRMTCDIPGGNGCNVYLDGEKLRYCIEADDLEGWARCAVQDAHGRLISDHRYDDGLMVEMRVGSVTFTFDPPEERTKAEAWHVERKPDAFLAS